MSITSLPITVFDQLTIEEHEFALDLYDKAISDAAQEMVSLEVDFARFADDRDDMDKLFTLRKIHQVRRDEMLTETNGSTAQAAAQQ